MTRYYPAIIEKMADAFAVVFPDLPDCGTSGATMQEAAHNAEVALQAYVDRMADRGGTLPAPSDLGRLWSEANGVEVARILVRADVSGRSVRVNITMPEDLLAAVDRYAARLGYSRSGLLAQAVRERMKRDREAV
jgi:predicted RNase H-like HicB family nuclease